MIHTRFLPRIVGSAAGIPLLSLSLSLPYWIAGGLMLVGMTLVIVASRTGTDFVASAEEATTGGA